MAAEEEIKAAAYTCAKALPLPSCHPAEELRLEELQDSALHEEIEALRALLAWAPGKP